MLRRQDHWHRTASHDSRFSGFDFTIVLVPAEDITQSIITDGWLGLVVFQQPWNRVSIQFVFPARHGQLLTFTSILVKPPH
jgi:hypothetical protein